MGAGESERFDSATILAGIGESVVALDAKRKVTYWNPRSETLYGIPASEALGRPVFEAIPAKIEPTQAADIRSCLDRGTAWSGDLNCRRSDDSEFWVHVTLNGIPDRHGATTGYVCVCYDVSARVKALSSFSESEAM